MPAERMWKKKKETTSVLKVHRLIKKIPFFFHSLFTEPVEDSPVLVVDSKPLTVAWTNIDVDRAEVIVLLVSGGAGTWHLHV